MTRSGRMVILPGNQIFRMPHDDQPAAAELVPFDPSHPHDAAESGKLIGMVLKDGPVADGEPAPSVDELCDSFGLSARERWAVRLDGLRVQAMDWLIDISPGTPASKARKKQRARGIYCVLTLDHGDAHS